MRSHHVLVAVLVLAGCDKENKDDQQHGCDIYPTADAYLPVPVGPATFDQLDSTAMNQSDLEMDAQLPSPRLGSLRRGPCGVVGLAFRRTLPAGGAELAYVELVTTAGAGPSAPETVSPSFDPGLDLSLFYETDCTPVILLEGPDDWTQYTRDGGTWTSAPAGLDLEALTGSSGHIRVEAGDVSLDGDFHLLASTSLYLVHGTRAPSSAAPWTFEALSGAPGTSVEHYRVDSGGTIHAAFTRTTYPCDPCDVTLYYGTLAPGGDWTTDVLQAGVWGPPLDEYATTPYIVLAPSGRPFVAAHFVRRVVTGSFSSTELRVYARQEDGSFCSEVVATATDGYQGTDGDAFTGALPVADIDLAGRVHVVFLDQSIWHDSSGRMNEIRGQLRHASRGADGWLLTTLTDQEGQTESPTPLVGYGAPLLALLGEDRGIAVAAVQHTWSTDSIYSSTDVPVTYEAHLVIAVP